jgi:hypothetical protein
LFDQRPDGRYIPKVSIQRHGRPDIIIVTDPEERTYRALNRAPAMGFWLLKLVAVEVRAQVGCCDHAGVGPGA